MRRSIFGFIALTAAVFSPPALGQEAAKKEAPAASLTGAPPPVMPDAETIVILTRTTLLTLNDAVRTGNFTVLRDTSAPGFREANTAAKLSRIFASLTQSGIDLAPVAASPPQLAEAPSLDPKTGMLRIKGHFPIPAARVDFTLLFEPAGGGWKLFGVSVQPAPAAAATGAAPAAPSAAKTHSASKAGARTPDDKKSK